MSTDTTPIMSTDTTPAKPQHNKLDLSEQIKLLDWCRQHEEKVKTLTDSALAKIAEAELGFKITTPNLASVRTAAGIEKHKPSAPLTADERLHRLEMVLGAFITWSQRELGESGAIALLKMLSEPPVSKPPAQPSPSLPVSDSPETLPGLETGN